jgi:glycosyltransferase involved in cell wall biosynthesis
MTKLGIIGTVGVPAKYGGFETLAQQLALNLKGEYDTTVYCSAKNYSKQERVSTWKGIRLVYLPIRANGIQSVIYDIVSMAHALLFMDVLLVLGVSGGIFLPLVKLMAPRKQVVVNVDGLEWRRAKWQGFAKRFLKFSEKVAVRFADEIVTDNAAIQKYVMDMYGVQSRLIEYGADHVEGVEIQEKFVEKHRFLAGEYALKVCRIEPENNIHLVLEAFARFGKMPLVLVGNWAHSEYGRNLRQLYRQYENLHLLDPIYEAEELNTLRSNCTLYVHGHSAGGTNPSLVEAMYLGLPILSFGAIYNRITTQDRALYFQSAEDIITVLQALPTLDLGMYAHNLKWIADMRYNWSTISKKYKNAFQGLEREAAPALDSELILSLKRLTDAKFQTS